MSVLAEWYPRAIQRLASINDEESLQPLSYSGAVLVLKSLAENNIKPNRIVGTAERSVAIWLVHEGEYRIEACSDGEFVMSAEGEDTEPMRHWVSSLAEIVKTLTHTKVR